MRYAQLGLGLGFLGCIAALAAVQIDRMVVAPAGIDATEIARAQALRLNVYGIVLIAAAVVLVASAVVLAVRAISARTRPGRAAPRTSRRS